MGLIATGGAPETAEPASESTSVSAVLGQARRKSAGGMGLISPARRNVSSCRPAGEKRRVIVFIFFTIELFSTNV
jgi:hypothetical protein